MSPGQKSILKISASMSALLSLIFVLWAFWLEPASLTVREQSINVDRWPASCSGLRVAILTDLHVGSPFNGLDNLEKIVAATNQAAADLILLPGDFVIHGVPGGHFQTPEAAAKILANLRAPLGVYAVLGNHDWWLDAPRVRAALESNGIAVLDDVSKPLQMKACEFQLVGLSDFWEGPHNLDAALTQVPPTATMLMFTHNPDVFPLIPEQVTLTIAGHTHGGQVYIPGFGRPVVPSVYGERYAIGHIVEDGKHLFVSSGIGTSILPVRFLVPPEITVLEIRSAVSPSGNRIAKAHPWG